MEEDDKGCPMIRMGVSGLIFLVPAYPGSPGQKAIKRLCVRVTQVVLVKGPLDGCFFGFRVRQPGNVS